MAPQPKSAVKVVFGAMTIDSGQEESRVSDLSEAGKILDIFNPTVTIKSTPLAFTAAVPYKNTLGSSIGGIGALLWIPNSPNRWEGHG